MRVKRLIQMLRVRTAFLLAQRDITLLVAARVSLLSLALVVLSVFTVVYGPQRVAAAYVPVALLFGFCALSALYLMWYRAGRLFTWIQLGTDIAAITGVIYFSGGSQSPFIYLYLVPVMGASILVSRAAGFAVCALSASCYTLLSCALRTGWMLPIDGGPPAELPTSALLLQITGLSSAMFLVAVVTALLLRKVSSSALLVEETQKHLTALSSHQNALFEGFTDGVITTQLDEAVTNVNRAALDLLRVGKDEIEGTPLSAMLNRLSPDFPLGKLLSDDLDKPHEIEIADSGGGEPRRLVLQGRRISAENGQTTGLMFFVQDVTKLRSIQEQLDMQERMARLLASPEAPRSSRREASLKDFVGESLIMQKIFNLIVRVATSDATVLVCGESGTGKELVARAIHHGSPRARGPFVAVNCGAIPENLIESELFGHRRGAFTGADSDYGGLFRRADGGTLFLDEIGELPLQMQAKLLRSLQDKKVRPVGSDKDIPVNVRIVAATNRNLKDEIGKGGFREDLYYRLNVININLPPLRDRKDDIPLLVNATLRRLAGEGKMPVVSPAAMQLLLQYGYPGNVRELENILERAVVLSGEAILPEHLTDAVRHGQPLAERAAGDQPRKETTIIVDESLDLPIDLDSLLAKIEKQYLEIALLKSDGVKKKAADMLGMNFRSFRYRLQKFGLNSDE